MAQTKHEIQALLDAAGTHPRHKLGQNFMIDQNLVRLVADAGEIQPNDLLIEIGPGTGTLTEEILSRGPELVAVELDRDLAAILREKFAEKKAFTLIEGDALAGKHAINEQLLAAISLAKSAGRKVKLVANLPYNIASPLVIDLLVAGVDSLVFTVQKEVADRLKAAPNTDAYGALSIMAQLLGEVETLRTMPPQAFWPMPKVESALVRIVRNDQLGARARDMSAFVHRIFSFRRKTLKKALLFAGADAEPLLKKCGIDGSVRPEVLSAADFLSLFQASES